MSETRQIVGRGKARSSRNASAPGRPMALRVAALAGAALLTTLMVSGCGQKGPLYLPPANSSSAPALPTHA